MFQRKTKLRQAEVRPTLRMVQVSHDDVDVDDEQSKALFNMPLLSVLKTDPLLRIVLSQTWPQTGSKAQSGFKK